MKENENKIASTKTTAVRGSVGNNLLSSKVTAGVPNTSQEGKTPSFFEETYFLDQYRVLRY